ncbi:MAG: hypothetical protein IKP37_06590 [Paludibacteraceae bacterium]|nr:hypothetical protein [Paludibacteraceae bacterium]
MLNTIKTLNIMTSLNTIKRKIKRFVILLLYCFSSIYAQSENIENSIWISSDSLIFFEYWEINEEPSRKVKISNIYDTEDFDFETGDWIQISDTLVSISNKNNNTRECITIKDTILKYHEKTYYKMPDSIRIESLINKKLGEARLYKCIIKNININYFIEQFLKGENEVNEGEILYFILRKGKFLCLYSIDKYYLTEGIKHCLGYYKYKGKIFILSKNMSFAFKKTKYDPIEYPFYKPHELHYLEEIETIENIPSREVVYYIDGKKFIQ